MLIKSILCNVPYDQQRAFDYAQRQWSPLSQVKGFLGQLGGWCEQGAVIFAFWESREAYDDFMNELHDDLFHSNKQASTYTSISVTLWDSCSTTSHGNDMLNSTKSISTTESQQGTYTLVAESENKESLKLTFHEHQEGECPLYPPWTVLPENK